MIWENTSWVDCSHFLVSLDQYVMLKGILDPEGQANACEGCIPTSQLLMNTIIVVSFVRRNVPGP